MDTTSVNRVRAFNRTVSRRIGALENDYVSRRRSLGAARVLWEIGDGIEVRALRARLGLDSGYLSRLLRSLVDDGLVAIGPGAHDRRVRNATLTAKGRGERRLLDRRSDELAASILDPLPNADRRRLLDAMDVVERLLVTGTIEIAVEDPAGAAGRACIAAYVAELDRRFPGGFDPGRSISAEPGELREPSGLFVVSRVLGEPAGCGALKFHADAPAELKRMWVSPDHRGLGIGRRLLEDLESRAAERGARVLRLETNDTLVEAVSLYRSAGYREVAAFNDEPYAHHWFEKRLP